MFLFIALFWSDPNPYGVYDHFTVEKRTSFNSPWVVESYVVAHAETNEYSYFIEPHGMAFYRVSGATGTFPAPTEEKLIPPKLQP